MVKEEVHATVEANSKWCIGGTFSTVQDMR